MKRMINYRRKMQDAETEVIRLAEGVATHFAVPIGIEDVIMMISNPLDEKQKLCQDAYRGTRNIIRNSSLSGKEFRVALHRLCTVGAQSVEDDEDFPARADDEDVHEYTSRVCTTLNYTQLGALLALGESGAYGHRTAAIAAATTMLYSVSNHIACGEISREPMVYMLKAAINFLEFDGESVTRDAFVHHWENYDAFRSEMLPSLTEQMQSETRHKNPMIRRSALRSAADTSLIRGTDGFLLATFGSSLFADDLEEVRFSHGFHNPAGHLINAYTWCAQMNGACMSRAVGELQFRHGAPEQVTAMLHDSEFDVTPSAQLMFETVRVVGKATSLNCGLTRSLFAIHSAVRSHRE